MYWGGSSVAQWGLRFRMRTNRGTGSLRYIFIVYMGPPVNAPLDNGSSAWYNLRITVAQWRKEMSAQIKGTDERTGKKYDLFVNTREDGSIVIGMEIEDGLVNQGYAELVFSGSIANNLRSFVRNL